MSQQYLESDEDAELRRLAALYDFGVPGPDVAARIEELRARDRRCGVRALRNGDSQVSVRDTGA